MFTTSAEALASAIREDTIAKNLSNLAVHYEEQGNMDRAQKLTELSRRRGACMLDDFGDALRLESEGR